MFENVDRNSPQPDAGTYAQTGFDYQQKMNVYFSIMMYFGLRDYGKIIGIYCELIDI